MKSCSYCHRTFHKTEHLLRHERSHTGEKPYRCDTCGRGYARSDVLLRHVRYFHPSSSLHTRRRSSDIATGYKSRHRRQSLPTDSVTLHSTSQSESDPGLEAETEAIQQQEQVHDAAQQGSYSPISIGAQSSSTAQQAMSLDLDALAAVSMLQALHEQSTESTNSAGLVIKERLHPDGQAMNNYPAPFDHGDEASPLRFADDMVETALETTTPTLLTANAEFLGPEISLGERPTSLQCQSGQTINGNPYLDNALQYTGGLDLLQPNLSSLDFLDFNLGGNSPTTVRDTQTSGNDPVSSIPLERFAHVAALWPRNKTHEASQIASKVWDDIVDYRGDNICTDISISESSPNPTIGIENESRWGMDDEKRQDLIREFGSLGSTNPADFLPVRLLNLGLTIAFRQPHSLVPFIHQPTFSAKSASNSIIDDQAWKAWARTESFKRLIATLIMCDAWWASKLNAEPLIRTSVVLFEMPASINLFRSSSAKSWRGLQESGASTTTEPIEIQMYVTSLNLTPPQDTSPIGMTGLLSAIWIRILHHQRERASRSRLSIESNNDVKGMDQLSGCILATNESGNSMLRILGDIYIRYSRFLRYRNPNCIALWHFLNLTLLADIEIFELASGRDGAESAYTALHEISNWSQTWYARRACLHAAGIYIAMGRRRANDGIMLHSDMSLFRAALVLGLYVFMMQPNEPHDNPEAEPFELLEEIDWTSLDDPAAMISPRPMDDINDRWNNSASCFVKHGGIISFSGTVCEGGYNAAKMILLEFASLLEEVGKWNAKELSYILRIMSDSLIDVDDRLGGD
ncbi:hypothetical protein F53441_8589 [Fusarium austroafricanum]|uniref:C2H2-type domain-containing protein n=1 Tax=Fusarium austroafricanum TaxID=2364996 RepID=A0A8H4NUA2_9HYPO|nr:hypothetical protein F53441_8589 [Fusarium austroafricanum]